MDKPQKTLQEALDDLGYQLARKGRFGRSGASGAILAACSTRRQGDELACWCGLTWDVTEERPPCGNQKAPGQG